jgi:MFS family permease
MILNDNRQYRPYRSATMLGYAITQIPAGILSDILGSRKTLAIYQAVAGISCIFFAYAPTWEYAVVSRFVLGLALAVNVPALKLLAFWIGPSSYSKASSGLLTFSTIGTLLASTPLVAASSKYGWKISLFGAGLFTIFLAITALLFLKDKPRTPVYVRVQADACLSFKQGLMKIIKLRNFWMIFIWFTLMVGNLYVLVTMWWGAFLIQCAGFNKTDTG